MKRKLPKFSSDEEFAEWIETHDTSEYMDQWEVVTDEIKVQRTASKKESVGVDLNRRELNAIKRVAKRRGVPHEALIKDWVIEKLRQEGTRR
jgi:predicted DNA binding CopG/RHH family protein